MQLPTTFRLGGGRLLGAIAALALGAPAFAEAQSLVTGVSGQAQVADLDSPGLTRTETINLTSLAGAPLAEQRAVNVEYHPNALSSQHAFANIAGRASAAYGFLRAAVTADAGYDQAAYVPEPGGGTALVAPTTLPLRPTTLAQATARCRDEITVTSATVAAGGTVPFTLRVELSSARRAVYRSADGADGAYDDAGATLASYAGITGSSGVVAGLYTAQGLFVNADAILTLRVAEAAAPGVVLWTKTLRAADAGGLFFVDFAGEVAADLGVGKTYVVEGELLATARSDGGAAYVAAGWSQDPSRKDNRAALYGIDVTKTGGRILITPASGDGDFTAKSGARYDGVDATAAPDAPRVAITGRKRVVTRRTSVVVRGTTRGAVTGLRARVGAKAAFRPVEGGAAWRFTARVRPGPNVITVVARGPGGDSAPAQVTIVRK